MAHHASSPLPCTTARSLPRSTLACQLARRQWASLVPWTMPSSTAPPSHHASWTTCEPLELRCHSLQQGGRAMHCSLTAAWASTAPMSSPKTVCHKVANTAASLHTRSTNHLHTLSTPGTDVCSQGAYAEVTSPSGLSLLRPTSAGFTVVAWISPVPAPTSQAFLMVGVETLLQKGEVPTLTLVAKAGAAAGSPEQHVDCYNQDYSIALEPSFSPPVDNPTIDYMLRVRLGRRSVGLPQWDVDWGTGVRILQSDAQRWIHVAVSWDDSAVNVYVDGSLRATKARAGTAVLEDPTCLDAPLLIGAARSTVDGSVRNFFEGRLDNLQLWRQLLTADQVAALSLGVHPEAAAARAPLAAWWRFDEGVGVEAVSSVSRTSNSASTNLLSLVAAFQPAPVLLPETCPLADTAATVHSEPSWVASSATLATGAPADSVAVSPLRPTLVQLQGHHAQAASLWFVITELPPLGSLCAPAEHDSEAAVGMSDPAAGTGVHLQYTCAGRVVDAPTVLVAGADCDLLDQRLDPAAGDSALCAGGAAGDSVHASALLYLHGTEDHALNSTQAVRFSYQVVGVPQQSSAEQVRDTIAAVRCSVAGELAACPGGDEADTSAVAAAAGLQPGSSATVTLLLAPRVNERPQVRFSDSSDVLLALQGYRLADVDVSETNGGAMSVQAAVTQAATQQGVLAAPSGELAIEQGDSGHAAITVDNRDKVDLHGTASGIGIRDTEMQFDGTLSNLNAALQGMTVTTPRVETGDAGAIAPGSGDQLLSTTWLGVSDRGLTGAVGPVGTAEHGVTFGLRTGSMPTITSVSPTSAPASGGLLLRVRGANFPVLNAACEGSLQGCWCVFAHTPEPTRAVFAADSELVCTIPAHTMAPEQLRAHSSVLVWFGSGSGGFGSHSVPFTYTPALSLASVQPSSGSVRGGTRVRITGTGLTAMSLGTTLCMFAGTQQVVADIVEEGAAVECTVPPHAVAHAVDVAVSVNGVHWATLSNAFTYTAHPTVTAIVPRSGPLTGGDSAIVTVAHGASLKNPVCYFGAVQSPTSTRLAPSTIRCEVPPMVDATHLIADSLGEGVVASTSSCSATSSVSDAFCSACVVVTVLEASQKPDLGALVGSQQCSATASATTRASSAAGVWVQPMFTYYAPPRVLSMTPACGSAAGGTTVTVTGAGFVPPAVASQAGLAGVSSPTCRFGEGEDAVVVAAQVLSTTTLQCVSPAFGIEAGTQVATVPLEVSLNSFHFTATQSRYKFYQPPTLETAQPTVLHEDSLFTGTGTGFSPDVAWMCRLVRTSTTDSSESGPFLLHATAASGTIARCGDFDQLPVHDLSGTWTLSLVANAVDVPGASESTTVTFVARPVFTAMEPTSGPTSGGTKVTVTAATPLCEACTAALACRFGMTVVPATLASPTTVRCITPGAVVAGAASVAVTVNGVDYTAVGSNDQFVFAAPPQVLAVTPRVGSTRGGTTAIVTGHGFVESSKLACRLSTPSGDATYDVPAQLQTMTSIACLIPPVATAGTLLLDVTNNGQQFSDTAVTFKIIEVPLITSLSPVTGTVGGGTTLSLAGTGLSPHEKLVCNFLFVDAGVMVPTQGSVASPFAATCTTPPVPPTVLDGILDSGMMPSLVTITANITIHLNGVDFNAAEGVAPWTFAFHHPVELTAVSPVAGSVAGGTTVTIMSTGVPNTQSLRCKFGDELVPATWLTASALQCVSPPAPQHVAGTVDLSVSLNSAEASAPLHFQYTAAVTVAQLVPTSGPVQSATAVLVSGTNFEDSPSLRCMFGDTEAEAHYLSSTLIKCMTPASLLGSGVGAVSVRVSINGVDYVDQGLVFHFKDQAPASAMFPSTAPISGSSASVLGSWEDTTQALECHLGCSPSPSQCDTGCTVVPAVRQSATVASCPIAPVSQPCRLSVRVQRARLQSAMVDGEAEAAASAEDTFWLELVQPPVVTSLEPAAGFVTGGSSVRVTGSHFVDSPELVCVFGSQRTPVAQFISDSELLCQSPPATGGEAVAVTVAVALSGMEPSGSLASFEYRPVPQVTSLAPDNGPAGDLTVVTLTGTGFEAADGSLWEEGSVLCKFGELGTATAMVAGEEATCTVPAVDATATGMSVPVSLSTNGGADFVPCGLQFTFAPSPTVTAITPSSGPESGGTTVVITGTHFVRSPYTLCEFKGAQRHTQAATWLSPTQVSCVTPALRPGLVSVRVTNTNGQQWSQESLASDFTVYTSPKVATVTPPGANAGFVEVTVRGSGFADMPTLSCAFNGALVPAMYVSDDTVRCTTPPISAMMATVTQQQASRAGVGSSETINVAVTNNGVDLSSTTAPFLISLLPEVDTMVPTWGPVGGGTTVVLRVALLDVNTAQPVCKFAGDGVDAAVTGALREDGESVSCATPAATKAGVNAVVSLSLDGGVSYLPSQVTFRYQGNALSPH